MVIFFSKNVLFYFVNLDPFRKWWVRSDEFVLEDLKLWAPESWNPLEFRRYFFSIFYNFRKYWVKYVVLLFWKRSSWPPESFPTLDENLCCATTINRRHICFSAGYSPSAAPPPQERSQGFSQVGANFQGPKVSTPPKTEGIGHDPLFFLKVSS